jgi:hypothetical protein
LDIRIKFYPVYDIHFYMKKYCSRDV